MRIIMILTNSFDPDPRVYKEAKTLVEMGATVEILAWDREKKYLGKSLDNYEGIIIKRFFADGRYGSGLKQILGYFNFINQINKYLNNTKFEYLHCHDFDALIPGFIVKLFNSKVQIIYDEHDLFYLYFEGRKGLLNRTISKLIKIVEKFILKRVHSHIVVTPNMKSLYESLSNPVVITNAPMKKSFQKIEKSYRDKTVIGFIGVVRYLEELKILTDIASKFSGIELFIAGRGTKLNELKEYVNANGYSNVEFFGEYDISQLEYLYKRIDITYLVYPVDDSIVSLPNKFFESIITRTPIISSIGSEFGEITENKKFGWCIDNNNLASQLTSVLSSIQNENGIIDYFKENMIKNGNNYLWENNAEILKDIYKI